jgi:hypothetical protein
MLYIFSALGAPKFFKINIQVAKNIDTSLRIVLYTTVFILTSSENFQTKFTNSKIICYPHILYRKPPPPPSPSEKRSFSPFGNIR